jgi:hypothetical protein
MAVSDGSYRNMAETPSMIARSLPSATIKHTLHMQKRPRHRITMTRPLIPNLPNGQDETLLLLSDCSAELHRLVLNFFAACAESNGRDDSCENDEFLHLLLSIRLVNGPSV